MYNPNKYCVSLGEMKERIENGLDKLRKVIQYSLTDTRYVNGKIIAQEIDLSYIDDFGVTADFISKFLDGEAGDPNLETTMKFISASDIGATALGFIDTDDEITDSHGKRLSGLDAVSYCFNHLEADTDEILSALAERFQVSAKKIKDTILGNIKDCMTIEAFIKLPVSDVLFFTLCLGIPIQSLFDYNFYSTCDMYFEG